MTYLKLVLEGFGCFSGRKEFQFSDGINTMSELNEAGKSTMLNGLVHTLYGLERAGKERFRSWAGSAAFRGELTLSANGSIYIVSMDFEKDKVSVAIFDEDTKKFASHIREQSHVPAGKVSKTYMDFLQSLTGTVDVDVFRSAFVVDQPMDNQPELGEGWELVAGEAGGAIEGAVENLLKRLGRDDEKGITRHLKDYGEPRDMNNDRILENKLEELSSLRSSLARAASSLDSIAPLIEDQKKAEEKIGTIRKSLADARAMKESAESWRRIRDRWDSKNRELNILKSEIERIKDAQLDRKRHSDDLAALQASAKGPAMEKARLEELRRSVDELRRAASESEGIKANYLPGEGFGAELRDIDIMKQGAEGAAAGISAKASEELDKLKESARKNKQWAEKYGVVAGLAQEERVKMGDAIKALEAGKVNKARNAQLIKFSPYMFIIAGLAAAYFVLEKYANRGSAVAIIVASAALGFLVKSYLSRKAEGTLVMSPEEESQIRGKLQLLSDMDNDPMPYVPEGLEAHLKSLESVIGDARKIEKLAYRVSPLLERISPVDAAHAAELVELEMDQDVTSILGMDEAFWASAVKENTERARIEKLISDKKGQLDNDDAIISSLMKGKQMSIQELESSLDALTQQVAKIMGDWMEGFQDDPFMKVSADASDLAAAMEVEKKAQGEIDRLERVLEDEKTGIDQVKDGLREARAGNIVNIPEIEERIDALNEEIEGLRDEALAIQVAVRELRAAGQDFSSSSARMLKGRITGLLEAVTGNPERTVNVGGDFKLSLSANGRAVEYEQLSQGTRDQLYICMRVAAAELLGEGRSLPMFFDDSFGTTDAVRLRAMKALLEEMSGARQFIILSHSHDIDGWGARIKVSP